MRSFPHLETMPNVLKKTHLETWDSCRQDLILLIKFPPSTIDRKSLCIQFRTMRTAKRKESMEIQWKLFRSLSCVIRNREEVGREEMKIEIIFFLFRLFNKWTMRTRRVFVLKIFPCSFCAPFQQRWNVEILLFCLRNEISALRKQFRVF